MIDLEKCLTRTGGVNSKFLNKLSSSEVSDIESETSFLQLSPSLSQRIKAIKYSVKEHKKCVCGNYLPYSSNKKFVFRNFCCMSCAKKENHNEKIIEKFRNTIQTNKVKINSELEFADILDKNDVINFFKQNISIFSNGGSKGVHFLNKNINYKKSLFFYTSENSLNGRIYELLYGKGFCEICSKETFFISLEKGYKPYCSFHGKLSAPKIKGLNSISAGIEKIKTFDNFSDFEIIKIPQKLNDSITVLHKNCGESFDLYLNNGKVNTYILRCKNCQSNSISNPEIEIRNWLKTINIEHIPQYKIKHKKIDIVIPNNNLAIEYNGLMNHSFGKSKYSRFNNFQNENKNIHLDRTLLCEEKGLKLFHIFENEWLDKTSKEIWKSIIKTNLGLNQKIYGRKCQIKEIKNNDVVRKFLNENHIQGYCKSFVKFGLFYENELVSIMTFGKSRFSKKYEWELIRFCNKININVIGGASKLFKHFIKSFSPNTIISYCDLRLFTGEMYETIGFKLSHKSDPNYFYFKGNKIFSRYDCQKHKLKELLDKFDSNITEKENMFNNGYRRIWDCGNKVYIWKNY